MKRIDKAMKIMEVYREIKYKCQCGHSVIIPAFMDKKICDWCGHWVYKSKQDEFKDKFKKIKHKLEVA